MLRGLAFIYVAPNRSLPRGWPQRSPACVDPKSQRAEGICLHQAPLLSSQSKAYRRDLPLPSTVNVDPNRSVPRGVASKTHRLCRPKSQDTEEISLRETMFRSTRIAAHRGDSPQRNTVYIHPKSQHTEGITLQEIPPSMTPHICRARNEFSKEHQRTVHNRRQGIEAINLQPWGLAYI